MRPVLYREVKRKLKAAGFVEVGQTGSHAKFAKRTSEGTLTATVPKHREVAPGTITKHFAAGPPQPGRIRTAISIVS